MEFRNPVFCRADGSAIDLEYNNPDFGWLPFTARADDVEQIGKDLFAAAQSNAAPYVAPPPAPYQIAKTTPWLRMTDAEAATMDAVMSETTARLKQIYMAAQYLSSDDALWGTLHDMLTAQFGAARADALLAPEG